MTLQELITAERAAIDDIARNMGSFCTSARRKRAYAQMRRISEAALAGRPLPDIDISECYLALQLRAKDVLGVSPETGFYVEPARRKSACA